MFKIAHDMPMKTVQHSCRRTREHTLSYVAILSMNEKNEALKFNDAEKIKKEIKNKRCMVDQDHSLINKIVDTSDVDVVFKDVGKDVKVMKFDFIKRVNKHFILLF